MKRRKYIAPAAEIITPEEIEAAAPLLMSGACYSCSYSSCSNYSTCSSYDPGSIGTCTAYDNCSYGCFEGCSYSCYGSCNFSSGEYANETGTLYILLTDSFQPTDWFPSTDFVGHAAFAIELPTGFFEVFNYSPWNNQGVSADGAVSMLYVDSSYNVDGWNSFVAKCSSSDLRLTNARYATAAAAQGNDPYWVEHFSHYASFSLPVVDLQFIRSYAYARMLSPGTFNIATKNCLQFVVGAINNGGYVCVNAFGVPIQTLGTAPNDWYDMLDRLRSSSTGTDVNYSNKSTI